MSQPSLNRCRAANFCVAQGSRSAAASRCYAAGIRGGTKTPRRMLAICNNLGVLGRQLLPEGHGKGLRAVAVSRASWRNSATTSRSSAAFRTRTWTAAMRRKFAF